MHQMFSQGELYFTMSNNDGEVDNKVTEGTLPAFARSYVLDAGTVVVGPSSAIMPIESVLGEHGYYIVNRWRKLT